MQACNALPDSSDVIVVGSGAAGMCAAIVLKLGGLNPVIIEKTEFFGGSTAVSGGAVWIPQNHHCEEVGRKDTRQLAMQYLEGEIGNRLDRLLVEAFLENGPKMVRFLEENTSVKFAARALGPDYHSDREGASLGGRVMDPLDYDGRELGQNFDRLRPPIEEFTILGGMMVGRADLGHLPRMFKNLTSLRHAIKVFARHGLDRLSYKRGTRLALGNALAARLAKTVFDLGIPLYLNTPLTGIERNSEGKVDRLICGDRSIRVNRAVILASGGFPSNVEMRQNWMTHTAKSDHFSMSPAGNTGDSIALAMKISASTGQNNLNAAFWTPVSRLRRSDGTVVSFPHLFLDRAKPGLIAVTGNGNRFVNESASYHDFVLAMIDYMEDHEPVFYLVCDHRFIRRYGLGAVRPFPGRVLPFIKNGYLVRAASIGNLESKLALPSGSLKKTIARYNEHARNGEDPEFDKGGTDYNRYLGDPDNTPNPCLRALDRGPYYAVRVYPGDIGTSKGLQTDSTGNVLDDREEQIEGLYACGNDMNSIMAGSYPGPGITLGPALTFGYIVANAILEKSA